MGLFLTRLPYFRKDGKQVLSTYDVESGVRKTFVADKNKVDVYKQKNGERGKSANKFCASGIGLMFSLLFAFIGDLPKIARTGCGIGAAVCTALTIAFGLKANNLYQEEKAILKDIENSQQQ